MLWIVANARRGTAKLGGETVEFVAIQLSDNRWMFAVEFADGDGFREIFDTFEEGERVTMEAFDDVFDDEEDSNSEPQEVRH